MLDAGGGKYRPVMPAPASGFETCLCAPPGVPRYPSQCYRNPSKVTPEMKTKRDVITDDSLPPEVIQAIEQGRKIEAIKLLRETTGLGLANAKVLVDKASRQHGPKYPHPRIVDDRPNLGRLLKTLLFVAMAFALYRYYGGT
jgi:hypothetical protein